MKKQIAVVSILIFCVANFILFSAGKQETVTLPSSVSVIMPRIAVSGGYPDLITDYEKKNPGIKVNLLMLPEQGYEQKVMLELGRKGDAYDVVWANNTANQRYSKEGWLEALEPFINNQKLTDAKDFNFSDLKNTGMFTEGGKLYALPAMNATCMMYYRTDIFAKNGITSPPANFDQLIDVCKKIHSTDVAAVAMRGSRARAGLMWPFPYVAHSFGARFVKDYPKDMHPVIDSPEMIRAVEFYANLLQKYGFPGATTAHFAEVVQATQQGKAAIMMDGAPLAGRILDPEKSAVVGKIGFAMLPAGPVDRWPPASAHGLTIPVGSKNKEGGWHFLQWALSKETQLKNGLQNNETALTRTSVLEDPEYKKKFNWGDGAYLKALSDTFAVLKPYYYPLSPEWDAVYDLMSIGVSDVITGQSDAKTAMSKVNAQAKEIYKKAGYFTD